MFRGFDNIEEVIKFKSNVIFNGKSSVYCLTLICFTATNTDF